MPRVQKQVQSHKYDRPYLEALKRKNLQALARKEGIKANVKSEEIIVQLLTGNNQPTEAEKHSRSNSVESERRVDKELRESNEPPCGTVDERARSENPNEDEGMPYDHLTDREVRDIRRRLKKWNDEIVSSHRRIEDVGEVLSFAERVVSDVGREVESMMKYRIAFEGRVVRRLHVDRHTWDGTRRMPAKKRAKWKEFVRENDRKIELERERRKEEQRAKRHEAGIFSESDSSDSSVEL